MPAENRATSEVNAEQGDAKPGTERPALTNTRSQPHFETWAIGCAYGDVWQLFKKAGDKWHHRGPFKGLCSGRQAELLKKFADGGGFLSDDAARKLFRETYGESDKVRILKIVKPVLSALRRVIRVAVAGTKNTPDPLPRDKHMHGWQARIQIGYAFDEEGKWLFKTKQQLSPEELLDSCPRVRVQPPPTS